MGDKGTAWSIQDRETGEFWLEHVSKARAVRGAEFLRSDEVGVPAEVVEHFISPLSCKDCADIAAGHASLNRTRR